VKRVVFEQRHCQTFARLAELPIVPISRKEPASAVGREATVQREPATVLVGDEQQNSTPQL
jgi:hypothetical protein